MSDRHTRSYYGARLIIIVLAALLVAALTWLYCLLQPKTYFASTQITFTQPVSEDNLRKFMALLYAPAILAKIEQVDSNNITALRNAIRLRQIDQSTYAVQIAADSDFAAKQLADLVAQNFVAAINEQQQFHQQNDLNQNDVIANVIRQKNWQEFYQAKIDQIDQLALKLRQCNSGALQSAFDPMMLQNRDQAHQLLVYDYIEALSQQIYWQTLHDLPDNMEAKRLLLDGLVENPVLDKLDADIITLRAQIAHMSEQLSADHPQIQAMQSELKDLQQSRLEQFEALKDLIALNADLYKRMRNDIQQILKDLPASTDHSDGAINARDCDAILDLIAQQKQYYQRMIPDHSLSPNTTHNNQPLAVVSGQALSLPWQTRPMLWLILPLVFFAGLTLFSAVTLLLDKRAVKQQ